MTKSRSAIHLSTAVALAGLAILALGCGTGTFLQNTLDDVTGVDGGLLTVDGDPAVAIVAGKLQITVNFSRTLYAASVVANQTIIVETLQGVPIDGVPVVTDDQIVWTTTDPLTLTEGAPLQLLLVGSPQLHGGVGVIQALENRDGVVTPGMALDGNGDNQPYGDYTFEFPVPAA